MGLTQSSGDTGSQDSGIRLEGHITGNPTPQANVTANVTVAHTWLIIVGAVVLLWLFGGTFFRSIRM
jgi:hypothetical protein